METLRKLLLLAKLYCSRKQFFRYYSEGRMFHRKNDNAIMVITDVRVYPSVGVTKIWYGHLDTDRWSVIESTRHYFINHDGHLDGRKKLIHDFSPLNELSNTERFYIIKELMKHVKKLRGITQQWLIIVPKYDLFYFQSPLAKREIEKKMSLCKSKEELYFKLLNCFSGNGK